MKKENMATPCRGVTAGANRLWPADHPDASGGWVFVRVDLTGLPDGSPVDFLAALLDYKVVSSAGQSKIIDPDDHL